MKQLENKGQINFKYGKQYFDKCVAAFYYRKPMSDIVCNFKFKRNWNKARALAKIFEKIITFNYEEYAMDIITFVPELDKNKKHVLLLAREAARQLNKKYKPPLKKICNNKTQHNLSRQECLNNTKGVYMSKENIDVHGKNIILIDDIVTTGSTLNECARILKFAEANEVLCAAICATRID
ncbi:MAG: ComF family protein [Oscillospiraceae bacterium]